MIDSAGIRRGFGAALLAVIVACCVLGVVTITKSPILITNSGKPLTGTEISHLRNVAGVDIPSKYFLRFPEFRATPEEARWWTLQRKVANALAGRSSVKAVLEEPGVQRHPQTFRIAHPNMYQAIKRSWLFDLAVVLYCLIAWSVYNKHDTEAGTVLALFCLSGALYFATSAPIVSRGIALPFPAVQLAGRYQLCCRLRPHRRGPLCPGVSRT